jgi:polyphosphate kinase 2 (PPK2 family)
VLVKRVEKLIAPKLCKRAYQDIVDFEHTIADDGYVIIKFFLHISKKEQAQRFHKLEHDPLESWHVQKEDWQHHKHYEEYVEAIEAMLERTETEWGPWTVVEATDRRWTRHKVFSTIVGRLEQALAARGKPLPGAVKKTTTGRRRHA